MRIRIYSFSWESVLDGFVFVDRLSWDNFNESTDLIDQIETYKNRLGFYPESVHTDKIYRTRENLRYCKKHGIRVSGPKLGRPPKKTEENRIKLSIDNKLAYQDEIDRIAIEGKFGLCKRRYSLGRIMTKLDCTSKTAMVGIDNREILCLKKPSSQRNVIIIVIAIDGSTCRLPKV